MKKRLLAGIMSLCMVFSLLPVSALAVDNSASGGKVETATATAQDDLVTFTKTVSKVDGTANTFQVELKAETKDTVTPIPAETSDIVLVIDGSGSMGDDRRLQGAKDAANAFAAIVLAEEYQEINKVSVISFGTGQKVETELTNDLSTVQDKINGITPGGGTNTQGAIHAAREVLADSEADHKVIVLLSDGEPQNSYRALVSGTWVGCKINSYPIIGQVHDWDDGLYGDGHLDSETIDVNFNYSDIVGLGTQYELRPILDRAEYTATCEHSEKKTWSDSYFDNHGQPAILEADWAKNDNGCEIYSIYLGESDNENATEAMSAIASENRYYNVTQASGLADLFKNLAGEITTPTEAGMVEDPMGQYVHLVEDSFSNEDSVTLYTDGTEGFNWDWSKVVPTTDDDGTKTYTLTYRVTLDVGADGFASKYAYHTNGDTTLTYYVGGEPETLTIKAEDTPTVFSLAAYTVTYNGNGSTSGTVPTDLNGSYEDGSTVTVLGNTGDLDKTDAVFLGWSTTKSELVTTEEAEDALTILKAEGSFEIDEDTILYAVWAQDVDENGIPDYNETIDPAPTQITVTYKIVGGTWDDGTTVDKTETLTLEDGSATPSNIPTPGVPSLGYLTSGHWDSDPNGASIGADTTYTYSFDEDPVWHTEYGSIRVFLDDATQADLDRLSGISKEIRLYSDQYNEEELEDGRGNYRVCTPGAGYYYLGNVDAQVTARDIKAFSLTNVLNTDEIYIPVEDETDDYTVTFSVETFGAETPYLRVEITKNDADKVMDTIYDTIRVYMDDETQKDFSNLMEYQLDKTVRLYNTKAGEFGNDHGQYRRMIPGAGYWYLGNAKDLIARDITGLGLVESIYLSEKEIYIPAAGNDQYAVAFSEGTEAGYTFLRIDITKAQPGPEQGPDTEDLESIFADQIQVTCVNNEHKMIDYGWDDVAGGYTKAEKAVQDDGVWTYTVTVHYAPFVDQYSDDIVSDSDVEEHTLRDSSVTEKTVKLVWTEETGWTAAKDQLPVVIETVCTNPQADYIQVDMSPEVEKIYNEYPIAKWVHVESNEYVGGYHFLSPIIGYKYYNIANVSANEISGITVGSTGIDSAEYMHFSMSGDNGIYAKIEVSYAYDDDNNYVMHLYCQLVEERDPDEPGDEKPDGPTDKEIIDPEGILGDAIQLDCVNHDPETYSIAANTEGQNDSYKIGEVEGSAEAGYTCDIKVYPLASYLKDYNTKYASVAGHTYDPVGQSDTITLVWVANGGSDGKSAWAVKDDKCATFAVKCELEENAPDPTYDQLKGLIGVQVVCDNQNHGEKTYELIENSYSFTVTGNTAAVTVQSSAYVAQYNDPDKGFPGHQIVGDSTKTVTLTWDTEKESWYTAAGTATVEFQVSCDNSEKYIITAVAGENGSIAPEGQVPVKAGAQQDFTFTPDDGYAVDTVYVINNGESKTYVNNGTTQLTSWEGYSFTNVNSDGYITVTFAEDSDGDGIPDKYEYTLTYDANGGKFYPIGDTSGQDTYSVKKAAGTYTLAEELPEEVIGPMYSQPVDKGKVLFAGWTTEKPESDDVGRIYQAGDTDVPATITSVEIVNGDVTVFAVWGYDEDEDGVADINEIVITPADIAIYTGGSNYKGDIVDENGDELTGSDEYNGFPEPGFYITLPTALNNQLQGGATGPVDLSKVLSFVYEAEGQPGKTWTLQMYNPKSPSNIAFSKYVYRMIPAKDQEPVRLQIEGDDGPISNDKLENFGTNNLFETYTMSIYGGDVKTDAVKAQLTISGVIQSCDIYVDSGVLTVRGTTESAETVAINDSTNDANGFQATAAGSNNYYINGSNIEVAAQDVHLLTDELTGGQEQLNQLQEKAEDALNSAGITETDGLTYDFMYLDLVDSSNGNAYVTMQGTDAVTIHWPMPTNADPETIHVVHFDGLDRNYTDVAGSIETCKTSVLGTDRDEDGNITFTTRTFSPFALVYETKDPGTGPDTDPDDDKDDDDHYTGGGGNDNDSDPTGNLSIELDVNGGDDSFTFTVYLTDKDGDDLKNNFYFNGDFTGTIGSGDEITLEGGDKIVIRNLPEGTRYEVIIETADGYTYVIDGEKGIIRTGTNEAEFTATRTVPLADPSVTGVSRWLNVTDHIAYLTGYPGGAFGPDNSMTRAEVAQMFYALLNNKNVTITKTFPDVPANAWYATAVNTLASLGMVSGDANGNYRPNDPITRAEFCVIALAFAYEPDNAVCYFSDVSRSDWFYTYVAQAASYGWIGGYTNGNFGPNDRITRAQVTTIVNNMLGRAADRDYVIDHQADLVQFTDLNRTYWGYYQIMEATNAHDYTKSNGTENWR